MLEELPKNINVVCQENNASVMIQDLICYWDKVSKTSSFLLLVWGEGLKWCRYDSKLVMRVRKQMLLKPNCQKVPSLSAPSLSTFAQRWNIFVQFCISNSCDGLARLKIDSTNQSGKRWSDWSEMIKGRAQNKMVSYRGRHRISLNHSY